MSWRPYRIAPLAVLAAAVIVWSCGDNQEAPVAPGLDDVAPEFAASPPAGGGSGAIFTTTPDGSVVNANVQYQDKREVYLDGGPPGNAPQTAAGLDDGYYVFQITDPPGKVLLSMDPARCRVVRIAYGIIVELVPPTDIPGLGLDTPETIYWADKGPDSDKLCHIQDDPDGVAGPSGQHDTNIDYEGGTEPRGIVVQMMPYGTTPNPGGVYKAWMTPLEAYLGAGGDVNAPPGKLNNGAVKKLPHPCPDFCAAPDPGFGPPRRYVKTDNFKVKEAPPMIHIFKFEDVNGNGYFDAGDKQIGPGTDQCVIEDNGSFKTVACSEPGAMGWPVDVCEDTNSDGNVDPGNTDAECTTVYTPAWVNGAFDTKFKLVEVLPGDWVNSVIKVGEGDAFNAGSAVCTQPDCDGSVEVFIPSYGPDKSVTFGNWKYSKKSGTKFHDTDADGDITDETLTLSGWTIFVDYNDNGSKDSGEPYDVTDANGDYTITNIKPGTFKVRELLTDQPGWFCSYPNAGAGDVVPPGVVKSTACYHQEGFTSGSEFKDNDFGNWTTTTKSGLKFEDKDADGQPKESGEPGLSGWTIFVDYNDNGTKDTGEPSAVTGSGGAYTITGIVPGTFKVREVLQDYWFCSFPNAGAGDVESPGVVKSSACYYQETFKSGVPETGNDFGNWKPGKKSGMKFSDIDYSNSYSYDDAPLSGFTFYVDYNDNGQLDPGEPYDESDANGDYLITGIVPGTWKVRELQKSGWTCVYPATKDVYGCYHQETFESQSVFTNNNFGNRAAEGCTPGYWKQSQHFDSWVATGYTPGDMLTGLFEEIGYMPYKNHYADQDSGEDPVKMSLATLLDALQMGGGETVPDKAEILVRAAVAAVLNAEHPDVAYGLTSAWIVAAVNSALDSRDATAIIDLAGKLDKANNGENGCPLN